MIRLLSILFFGTLLLGCFATTAEYKKMVFSWQGAPVDRLVQVWGYPTGSITAPNGNRVYVYQRGEKKLIEKELLQGVGLTNVNYDIDVDHRCTTYFETYNQTIVHVSFRGKGCVAYPE